ncbi:unnamed protein product [Spirodela intermedia]|uniref:Uncharacterized protein n=1 Tax=Spirodela intermedia TaxID=51605 RepID=A0A7I8L118_SPIIN|nr:unnamed protein product [Spirodela intermedia]
MNPRGLSSAANTSAPSVGASSVITDANSALSGGSHLQGSGGSINADLYPRLPASPLSFSSNISGSSVMDCSSIVQQYPHQEQVRKHGTSTATSQSSPQEMSNVLQAHKKPRFDMRHEAILQRQVGQQLLQRQDTIPQQSEINPQIQALIHQQRLQQRQQQQQQQSQMFQPLPLIQRAHMLQQQQQHQQQLNQHLQQQQHQHQQQLSQHLQQQQQQHQQQLSQHLQQQQSPHVRHPSDTNICARRLMQYIYHQRHRPPENNILYWRKFVNEYYASGAKKRWCLSLHNNVGCHTLGSFPQVAMDSWHCNICGSKSGKGFEASFEVLPRLNKIKFDSGVLDELLFLDLPRESKLPSEMMLLEYAKATLQSIHENLHVIQEGQLQIIFTADLKILSWDFCVRRHEELLPRRLVAPQVNQFGQVAQKYQSGVSENGSAGLSPQDLRAYLNMFMVAGRHLARSLESHSLNDLGFSRRYVRCLQISEVVNCMKDLIDFSWEQKIGPIDALHCSLLLFLFLAEIKCCSLSSAESFRNYSHHAATRRRSGSSVHLPAPAPGSLRPTQQQLPQGGANSPWPPPANLPPQRHQAIQQMMQEVMNSRGAPPQRSAEGATTAAATATAGDGNPPEGVYGGGIAGSSAARVPPEPTGNGGGMVWSRNSSFNSVSSNQMPVDLLPADAHLPDLIQEISQELQDGGLLTGDWGWNS